MADPRIAYRPTIANTAPHHTSLTLGPSPHQSISDLLVAQRAGLGAVRPRKNISNDVWILAASMSCPAPLMRLGTGRPPKAGRLPAGICPQHKGLHQDMMSS